MNKIVLYHKTIADIENKLVSNDAYDTLMIAGLLRKLLLDEQPLIVQVNRDLRLKLKFIVNDRQISPMTRSATFWAIQDGFDPDTAHMSVPKVVDLATMLRSIVLIANNFEYSVKDVLDQLNNVIGAVHAGQAKNEKEKVLQEIASSVAIGGMDPVIRSVKSISRVVLKGLKPLSEQLAEV